MPTRQVIGLFNLQGFIDKEQFQKTLLNMEKDYSVKIDRVSGMMDFVIQGDEWDGVIQAYYLIIM